MKTINSGGITHLWSKIVEYVTGLGYTSNTGTVTGVTMNSGSAISPDANGVVDLGTVVTSVPSNIVTGNSQAYTIWVGNETAYGQETVNNNTIYIITES